jgi:hypothetical protein
MLPRQKKNRDFFSAETTELSPIYALEYRREMGAELSLGFETSVQKPGVEPNVLILAISVQGNCLT